MLSFLRIPFYTLKPFRRHVFDFCQFASPPENDRSRSIMCCGTGKAVILFCLRYKKGCEGMNPFASQSYIYFSDFLESICLKCFHKHYFCINRIVQLKRPHSMYKFRPSLNVPVRRFASFHDNLRLSLVRFIQTWITASRKSPYTVSD